ncbi:MAG: hypothetical protein MZW92_69595 [Comamonadaceae bacterium]|nr:hypothetical protein [Comamonadaceae bacterium]
MLKEGEDRPAARGDRGRSSLRLQGPGRERLRPPGPTPAAAPPVAGRGSAGSQADPPRSRSGGRCSRGAGIVSRHRGVSAARGDALPRFRAASGGTPGTPVHSRHAPKGDRPLLRFRSALARPRLHRGAARLLRRRRPREQQQVAALRRRPRGGA